MERQPQSPLFSKTYDLLLLVIPLVDNFPKSQRFRLAARIEEAVFQFHVHLLAASRLPDAPAALQNADLELEKLRLYLRLAMDSRLISFQKYEQASLAVTEVGRLLGGWIRKKGS